MRRRYFFGCASITALQLAAGAWAARRSDLAVNLREQMKNQVAELNFRFGSVDWSLVKIPAGQFTMGTPLNEPGRESWELTPRTVRITRTFYLAKYEASNAQYRVIMGPQPHSKAGDESLSYDQARYRDALEFCTKLSKHLGVETTLPTEAQWEYACRAGTPTPYYTGSTAEDLQRAAWYVDNAGKTVHRGGEKAPNNWGLCDMLGNAAEPCRDYILSPDKLTEDDPVGRVAPEYGCVRGGSWMDTALHCRAGYRLRTRDNLAGLGIRFAINP